MTGPSTITSSRCRLLRALARNASILLLSISTACDGPFDANAAIHDVRVVEAIGDGRAFVVDVIGTGFEPASRIVWGDQILATTFRDANRLSAAVPIGGLTGYQEVAVRVIGPGEGPGDGDLVSIDPALPPGWMVLHAEGSHTFSVAFDGANLIPTCVYPNPHFYPPCLEEGFEIRVSAVTVPEGLRVMGRITASDPLPEAGTYPILRSSMSNARPGEFTSGIEIEAAGTLDHYVLIVGNTAGYISLTEVGESIVRGSFSYRLYRPYGHLDLTGRFAARRENDDG